MLGLPTERNKQMLNGSQYPQRVSDSPPAILIVENDEDSRLMLKLLLELWKFRVFEARDGIEALKIAEEKCPDLVLMDVKLPRLDGFETVQQIRRSAKIGSVPVVFISGCVEAVYRQKAIAVGGNGYLTKPLDFENLRVMLGKYISIIKEV